MDVSAPPQCGNSDHRLSCWDCPQSSHRRTFNANFCTLPKHTKCMGYYFNRINSLNTVDNERSAPLSTCAAVTILMPQAESSLNFSSLMRIEFASCTLNRMFPNNYNIQVCCFFEKIRRVTGVGGNHNVTDTMFFLLQLMQF